MSQGSAVGHVHPFIPLRFERLEEKVMIERSRSFFQLMEQRRTVRSFLPDPVPEAVIQNAIRTAGTAPSGAHKQPWHFGVVSDPRIKKQIRIAAEEEERRNYQSRFSQEWLEDLAIFETSPEKPFLELAPVLIAVFKENYRLVDGEKKKNYYVTESVGIATGMLIAALHSAGLACLTHTPNPMSFLNEILDRPRNEVPVVLLPVGYPAPDAEVPDLKRKALKQIMTTYS
jgi:nitroreductase